ncbi:MAG: CDP-alcohol phosphatidyltransferase family protein [Acidobacteriota bacterium]
MKTLLFRPNLRFLVPQMMTALRVSLGTAALIAVFRLEPGLAATLVIFGSLTDNLDGWLARRLGSVSEFGARFDYYADYLCYVVVPAALSFGLLHSRGSFLLLVILGLPLLTGAVRYSRNVGLVLKEDFEALGSPGLGTVFYAFLVIALVFLREGGALSSVSLEAILVLGVPALSLLMLAPWRYPKLLAEPAFQVPVAAGLILMPFVFSRFLAGLSIVVIVLYTAFSPLLIEPQGLKSEARADHSNQATRRHSKEVPHVGR